MNISYKRQNRAHEVGAKDRGDAGTDSTESSGIKKKKTGRKGTSKRGKRKRDRKEDRDEGRHKLNRLVWEV